MTQDLKVSIRNTKTDRNLLDEYKAIPGIVYGNKSEPTPIFVSQTDFMKVYKISGETEKVTLSAETKKFPTLIHDVQFDPVKNLPIHVDFMLIDETHPVHVDVPVEYVCDHSYAKTTATLVKVVHELEVEALINDIPHNIAVDISGLKEVGDAIHLKDIEKSYPKLKFKADKEEVLVVINEIVEEKEEESAPIDFDQIEVTGEKKEEVEETNSNEE